MNELKTNENIKIEDMIYEIRNKQVMLDSDLAILYNCANGTKSINLAVKRNINRFPERFMFQLTNEEYINLKFQNETSSWNSYGGIRKLPFVFTEQGVAMLATVLKTKVAEEISIKIMDAFVSMRKYISSNLIEQKYINKLVLEDHQNIKLLQESFSKLDKQKVVNEIYFNGQIYDAYSKILDIFHKAKNKIVIIDNYADKTLLDIINKLKVNIVIITKKGNLLTELDIDKYNKQYNNLKVIFDNAFHDRYFILDKKIIYHCGSSINRIGYKTFSINLLEDDYVIDSLLRKVIDLIK